MNRLTFTQKGDLIRRQLAEEVRSVPYPRERVASEMIDRKQVAFNEIKDSLQRKGKWTNYLDRCARERVPKMLSKQALTIDFISTKVRFLQASLQKTYNRWHASQRQFQELNEKLRKKSKVHDTETDSSSTLAHHELYNSKYKQRWLERIRKLSEKKYKNGGPYPKEATFSFRQKMVK